MHLYNLFESTNEAYYTTRGIDRDRYQERAGLEGPFQTKSGKVVYYDAKQGQYYDPDTDRYVDYDDYRALDEDPTEELPQSDTSAKIPAKSVDVYEQQVDEGAREFVTGALLAGLLGMGVQQLGSITDAKNSPLGRAMAQAAEQGDQYAAKHLDKLDFYFDANDTGSIKVLSKKYLGRVVEGVVSEAEVATTQKTQRMVNLMRARYPEAKTDLEALLLHFNTGQRQDREDISTLYTQNDQEEQEINQLQAALDKLKSRAKMGIATEAADSDRQRALDASMAELERQFGPLKRAKVTAPSKQQIAAKAQRAGSEAEQRATKRKQYADTLIKQYNVKVEPGHEGYFLKGVSDGRSGVEDRRAGDAYGPYVYAYDAGVSVGRKMRSTTNEDYYETDEQRELARLGRIIMDIGAKRDDAVGVAMGAVGMELTKYGTPQGASNIRKLEQVTGQPESVIMKMMALAQKVQGDVAQGEDVPDDEEEVKEIAPALGAIARGASKALGFGAGAVAGSVGSSADAAGDAAGSFLQALGKLNDDVNEAPMGFTKIPYPGYKGPGSDFRAYDEPDQSSNWVVKVDGKKWKVFNNKNSASKAASTIRMKYNKKTEVYATMDPVSEGVAEDFDRNFSKRVAATVRGGAGAEYLKKKADQRKAANPDAGKGLGPGVLDVAKARKKAAAKGVRPGSLRASPNTRDPERLPEAKETDIQIGDTVQTIKMGQIPGTVTGFSKKSGMTKVLFKHESGKTYASVPSNLRVISSKKNESINEDTSTFVDAGIPREYAERFLKKYQVKHDAKISPTDGVPKTSDISRESFIINVLPNGDVRGFGKKGDDWKVGKNFYSVLHMVDGKFTDTGYENVAKAKQGMSKQGKFYTLDGNMWSFYRDKKPDSGRDTRGDVMTGDGAIYTYMNDTFMKNMRPMMEKMVDDIYANLRKLDNSNKSFASPSDQERALDAAKTIEDVAKQGFTRETMERFLMHLKRISYGFASIPANERELRKVLKDTPNARAKWAKTILDVAKREHKRVKDMLYKPVMDKLTADIHTEEVGLDEAKKKPIPTKPELWSRAKAAAKQKYDVWPSAYSSAYAAKWYKEKGGGWRMGTKEDLEEVEQLEELKCWPGYERVPGTTAGKPGSCRKK